MTGLKPLNKLNKSMRNNLITIGIIVFVYIICQILMAAGLMSNLMMGLLVQFCYYSILAVSLNLTVGILGELSLGHAGFYCIGAFIGAFFTKCTQDTIPNSLLRFTIALLLGTLFAALFGAFISLVVLRLRGDYLAIVTLAFGEIIKNVLNALYVWKDGNGIHVSISSEAISLDADAVKIINGAKGINGIPHDTSFTLAVILLIITYLIISNLVNSRSGRAIMAIRDNRIASESIGIDVTKFKILAFSISAALAGTAGVLYSHNISTLTATPKNFGYNMSIMILVFVVLGGIGNIRGSIVAAVVLTFLPEYLRTLQKYRMLIYAVVLIVMMIFNWNPTCIAWRKKYSLKKLLMALQKKNRKEA